MNIALQKLNEIKDYIAYNENKEYVTDEKWHKEVDSFMLEISKDSSYYSGTKYGPPETRAYKNNEYNYYIDDTLKIIFSTSKGLRLIFNAPSVKEAKEYISLIKEYVISRKNMSILKDKKIKLKSLSSIAILNSKLNKLDIDDKDKFKFVQKERSIILMYNEKPIWQFAFSERSLKEKLDVLSDNILHVIMYYKNVHTSLKPTFIKRQ